MGEDAEGNSWDKETGNLFNAYKKATGGTEPIGLIVPIGYPEGVKEHGGVEAVYKECIEKGITWEELLNYVEPSDDIII